jgi:prepilin-type N-terminal cleavage/methylation domain-containing protein
MIRRRPDGGGEESGFALLEILVATAIAAVSLTILYSMIATAMRSSQVEQATIEASMLARSLLAEVTGGARTEAGEYWSDAGAEPRWRLRLSPAEGPQIKGGPRFLKMELAIWHLGEDRAPLEFATEVSVHDDAAAAQR